MKKIMVILLMMVAAAFASPLFAIDSSKVGCATSKSQAIEGIESIKTAPSDVTFVKVNVLHKDTLMYSLKEGIDRRDITVKVTDWGSFAPYSKINLAKATVAVVCYPRGETGV